MRLNMSAGSAPLVGRMSLRFLAVVLSSIILAPPLAHAATCESLSHLVLPDTTITLTKSETAETYEPGVIEAPGPPLTNLPPFCRVAAEVRPTPDSRIRFEVWMPTSGWNGKFMGVGNGGWSGEIWYPFMGAALRDNYTTASTDTGHQGLIQRCELCLGTSGEGGGLRVSGGSRDDRQGKGNYRGSFLRQPAARLPCHLSD